MPRYFADPAVQPTPGDRGKTTRRRSTKTVRGCEGAYIAMIKEELGPKVPVTRTWFRLRLTSAYKGGPSEWHYSHDFPTAEKAEEYGARMARDYLTTNNGWALLSWAVETVERTTMEYQTAKPA